jgi:hypothetical protein
MTNNSINIKSRLNKDFIVSMKGSRAPSNKIVLISEITIKTRRFGFIRKTIKTIIKEINPTKNNYTTKQGCRVFF